MLSQKETGELLVMIHHIFPSFVPSKETTESWREVLGDIPFDKAKKALVDHFRESEFPPKPYDVIKRATAKKKESEMTQDEFREYLLGSKETK